VTTPPTYLACLTPAGTGAIATLALQGPSAWSLVEPWFRVRGGSTPRPGAEPTFWLGRLGADWQDEVVVCVRGTGERQRVEIHCHGGRAVLRELRSLLCRGGAIERSWEDWLRDTTPSPLQAEAAIALGQAPTLRTAGILLDQYHGAFEQSMRATVEELQQALLDPPDSSLAKGESGGVPSSALSRLRQLEQWIGLGCHLTRPWRVVLAGAINVGKSSLINALLGYSRSITSPLPGTTRDVVTAVTAFDGWPVELCDTAGWRAAADGLEAEGIRLAQEMVQGAEVVLWLVDGSATPVLPPAPSSGQAEGRSPFAPEGAARWLLVVNKIDRPPAWSPDAISWPGQTIMRVSALTGEGIPALIQSIADRLVPRPPPPGAGVPFTAAAARAVTAALQALQAGALPEALSRLQACLPAAGQVH
jgi:tRNA modification GTPase